MAASENSLREALKNLFVNRTECYCLQLKQGYTKVAEPLTDAVLEQHLAGQVTVGSYQLDKDSLVKWTCFDLDPEKLSDPKAIAKQIINVLLEMKKETDKDGVVTEKPRVSPNCIVLEASRYPDPSYHIWLLFLNPVKAKVARWLALRTLELAKLNPKLIEVFPKQEEITLEKPFGNFVKLPFGKHQVAGKWSRLLDLGTFEPLPTNELEKKHGLSFSESEMAKLEAMETKRNVQIAFQAPTTTKKLSSKDEEKTVCFLMRYWQEGFRNDLTVSFCGLCIKQGVSHESAKRIIQEVCERTNTVQMDTTEFLFKVDEQFQNRAKIVKPEQLKGSSGIAEVIEAIREKGKQNAGEGGPCSAVNLAK